MPETVGDAGQRGREKRREAARYRARRGDPLPRLTFGHERFSSSDDASAGRADRSHLRLSLSSPLVLQPQRSSDLVPLLYAHPPSSLLITRRRRRERGASAIYSAYEVDRGFRRASSPPSLAPLHSSRPFPSFPSNMVSCSTPTETADRPVQHHASCSRLLCALAFRATLSSRLCQPLRSSTLPSPPRCALLHLPPLSLPPRPLLTHRLRYRAVLVLPVCAVSGELP